VTPRLATITADGFASLEEALAAERFAALPERLAVSASTTVAGPAPTAGDGAPPA
jgi:hypothetical protein